MSNTNYVLYQLAEIFPCVTITTWRIENPRDIFGATTRARIHRDYRKFTAHPADLQKYCVRRWCKWCKTSVSRASDDAIKRYESWAIYIYIFRKLPKGWKTITFTDINRSKIHFPLISNTLLFIFINKNRQRERGREREKERNCVEI